MQSSNTLHSLIAKLDHHKEDSQRLSALDDVTEVVQPLIKSIESLAEKRDAHFKRTAERYVTVLQQIMFLVLVCRRKIDAVNELIRFAINTNNAIALAQGARSIVEHVAVEAEISRVLNRFAEQIKGQTEGIKINEAMSKLEDFFSRCYFGKSPKIESNKAKQTLHIHDCIKTLDSVAPGLLGEYDYLCEFVHPNHGSNTLVSSVDIKVQVTSIVTDMNRPEIQRMGQIVQVALSVCEELEGKVHADIALLGFYAQRFMLPNSKISNIFAERKIKPVGNGKTKETAFFFPGSRDTKETFDLWSKYLENRNITVLGRQLAAMEGNVTFDLYDTTQGPLWHRIEYPPFDDGMSGQE